MRAGSGMAKKRTDLIRRFRRENVLELASLLLDLGLAIHGQAIGEKALCQPMPANDAACAIASARSQFDNHRSVTD